MRLFEIGTEDEAFNDWCESFRDLAKFSIILPMKHIHIREMKFATVQNMSGREFDCYLRQTPHGLGFPYKISQVDDGGFMIPKDSKISTFYNFPDYVGNGITMQRTPNIKSTEFITKNIGNSISLVETGITSFANVHKHIKEVGINSNWKPSISIPLETKSALLGFLLIKGLKLIWEDWYYDNKDLMKPKYQPLKNAAFIVQKHLAGDRDVLECQEELIKAGLKEYARL